MLSAAPPRTPGMAMGPGGVSTPFDRRGHQGVNGEVDTNHLGGDSVLSTPCLSPDSTPRQSGASEDALSKQVLTATPPSPVLCARQVWATGGDQALPHGAPSCARDYWVWKAREQRGSECHLAWGHPGGLRNSRPSASSSSLSNGLLPRLPAKGSPSWSPPESASPHSPTGVAGLT